MKDGKYKLGQREFVISGGKLATGNAWQNIYRLERAGFFTCEGHVDFFPTRRFYELAERLAND